MAQLTIRGVDEDIAAALKVRAAGAGRSAEAEHRRILEEALRPGMERDFFASARTRRIKLSSGVPDTTKLLLQARSRSGA